MISDIEYRDLIYRKMHIRLSSSGYRDDKIREFSDLYAQDMDNLIILAEYISRREGCYLNSISKIGDWIYIGYNGNGTLYLHKGRIKCVKGRFENIEKAKKYIINTVCSPTDGMSILSESEYKEFLDNVWKLYGTDVAMSIRNYGVTPWSGTPWIKVWFTERTNYRTTDIWETGDELTLDNICDNIDNMLYLAEHRRIKNEIEEF